MISLDVLNHSAYKSFDVILSFNSNSIVIDIYLIFLDTMNKVIYSTVLDYVIPIYNHTFIEPSNYENIEFTINDQIFLKSKTISYSSFKKKETVNKEKTLIEEITKLEANINNNNTNIIQDKKEELESIRKNKLNGHLIRRAKWIFDGKNPQNTFVD